MFIKDINNLNPVFKLSYEQAKKHALTREDEHLKQLQVFDSFVKLPDAVEAEKQKLVYKPNEVTMHVIRFGNQIQR